MTDQEIVRAAAEARGFGITPGGQVFHDGERWNPLTSDVDAMGLVDDLLSEKKAVWIYCTSSGVEVAVAWDHLVKEIRAMSPDRRRAITLAYLRAKGVAV